MKSSLIVVLAVACAVLAAPTLQETRGTSNANGDETRPYDSYTKRDNNGVETRPYDDYTKRDNNGVETRPYDSYIKRDNNRR
jgi:outer membrane biogenesis lipoprotein LolB